MFGQRFPHTLLLVHMNHLALARSATLLLLSPLCALAAGPVVVERIANRLEPLPYEATKIDGLLGDRMRVNLEGRLQHVDVEGILRGFENRPGTQPWIGEHVGKFLHAAGNTYRYTHDPKLLEVMRGVAQRFIATQMADGYLGTYSLENRWTSWDVWVQKYSIIGLITYYDVSGDERALAAARRVGELLERTFGEEPGKRDLVSSGTHVGMAATSVLEPICLLYRYTGDARFLKFARYIVHAYNQPHGPKIVVSLLEHGSVNRVANGKASELLSNLVGLTDLYRLTGESDLLAAVLRAWEDVRRNHMYLTGTASAHEYFLADHFLPAGEISEIGEGCVTVGWLQLTWRLWKLTGEARFGQEIERTVYNQLLGAQEPRTGDICYFTPMMGRKNPTPGINCCVSSETRGISLIPQMVWGVLDNALFVNLYTAGRARFEIKEQGQAVAVDVTSVTDFPAGGDVAMTVNPARPTLFTVALRVPEWAGEFTAQADGEAFHGAAGQLLRITRVWKPGSGLKVHMTMTTAVISGGESYPNRVALQRGPQVLAVEREWNADVRYIHRAGMLRTGETLSVRPVQAAVSAWPGRQVYEMEAALFGEANGNAPVRMLRLVPFADARDFTVWLYRPGYRPADPPAVTSFGRETVSEPGPHIDSFADDDPGTYSTFRSTSNKRGEPGWFAVALERPQQISRVVFRHGSLTPAGGWFDISRMVPQIQVKTDEKADWTTVARLTSYPWVDYTMIPNLRDGQPFEVKLSAPVTAVAIRILAQPGRGYASCAELSGYSE